MAPPHEEVLKRRRKAVQDGAPILERLRRICLAYPEAVEVEQFGEPWFKAGKKPFCIYEPQEDRPGVSFNVSLMDQSELLKDPRFERTPYLGQHGWTTLRFGGTVEWEEVEELVDIAYRRAANQRMLKALETPRKNPE